MSGLSDFFQTNPLYPFRFEPVYKHYLWGGSRLKELFNRSMNSEADCTAESWEVTDHPHGQSVVKNGQLRGTTLNDIVQYAPTKLFGQETVNSDVPPKQFPLLFKYLDAKQTLSVQVHPDIETIEKLQLNDNEKNECWLVAEAEPDSFLYLGTGRK
ncbi:MAG: hypothetical protein LBN39_03835 [Planctomycetaceae bacterium]|jgi:mannose-6-phosphate isomerase|nr:hypothetical protein [Planctomycetaceae bacterium]